MIDLLEVKGLCVDVKYLVLGPLRNNVYIISDGTGTMVVDPADNADAIIKALEGAKPDAIVLTHYHNDHTGALAELKEKTGARVIASVEDAPHIENPGFVGIVETSAPCKVDERVSNGDVVTVGNMPWKVIATPGHSKGSICLYIIPQFGNHDLGLPVLISGDTLFAGTVGRTDLEGGSMEEMAASVKKLAKLPDDCAVLPGHNDLTTIGSERRRVFARFGDEPDEL